MMRHLYLSVRCWPCFIARYADSGFTVFRIRWINAKCALTRCSEELIILRFEMQMCYLGYTSRANAWGKRKAKMSSSRAHKFLAQEYASHWNDLAAYAKERFNLCYDDVIHRDL